MDFEWIIKERLKEYPHKKSACEELKEQITLLESDLKNTKCSDPTAIAGGGSKSEDRWVNVIATLDLYNKLLKEAQQEVKSIERALDGLNSEQKLIITEMYISCLHGAADRCAEKLCCERTRVYRIKQQALRVLAIRLYG